MYSSTKHYRVNTAIAPTENYRFDSDAIDLVDGINRRVRLTGLCMLSSELNWIFCLPSHKL